MALLIAGTTALPAADQVKTLWQMPNLGNGLYSGYVPVAGT